MITEKHIITITRDDKYFKSLVNSYLEQGYKSVGSSTEIETFEKSMIYRIVEVDDNQPTPTIDAVQVVRCKDCTHADEYHHCGLVKWYNSADDFCSRGKRRET